MPKAKLRAFVHCLRSNYPQRPASPGNNKAAPLFRAASESCTNCAAGEAPCSALYALICDSDGDVTRMWKVEKYRLHLPPNWLRKWILVTLLYSSCRLVSVTFLRLSDRIYREVWQRGFSEVRICHGSFCRIANHEESPFRARGSTTQPDGPRTGKFRGTLADSCLCVDTTCSTAVFRPARRKLLRFSPLRHDDLRSHAHSGLSLDGCGMSSVAMACRLAY